MRGKTSGTLVRVLVGTEVGTLLKVGVRFLFCFVSGVVLLHYSCLSFPD